MKMRNMIIWSACLLMLAGIAFAALPKPWTPNYTAVFTGDIEGSGPVQASSSFLKINSDMQVNGYPLVLSSNYAPYDGPQMGYLSIQKTSRRSNNVEIYYTFGTSPYAQLHGHGTIVGDWDAGSFTVTPQGSFTITQGAEVTVVPSVSFVVTGTRI